MIAGLKPYPSYRASGVRWLGEVPEHWKVLPNRALFVEVKECGHPEEQLLSVTIRDGVVPQESLLRDSSKKDSSRQDKSAYKLVRKGDIAYNKMRAWQGAVGVSRYRGIVSPAYVVQRCRERANAQYFHYLLRTPSFVKEAERWSYGITSDMWSLRPEHFRVIYSCLPSPPEQASIVRFLDHADRRIRRYIRAKEKLMALLEEQKQTTIHRAVTGQIDVRTGKPYPAYKESGVGWLGKIPAQWEIIRFGKLIALTTGFPFKSEGFTQNAEDVRLLRGVNVAPGRLRWDETVRWPAAETATFGQFWLQIGDIVLGMDRPMIRGGTRVAIVAERDVPSLLLQRVARIRPGRKLLREFALLLMRGKPFADYLAPIFTGISVPHLSPKQIRGFTVALPSSGEQAEILESLAPQISAAQRTTDRAMRQITLLRESRTRLIADVVTGKIDVQEAAAQLPRADPGETDEFDGTSTTESRADPDAPGVRPDRLQA